MNNAGPTSTSRHPDTSKRRRAIAALIASMVIGSTVPILVRWSEVGPVSTAFWRMAIGGGLAIVVLRPWRDGRAVLSRGMVIGLGIGGALFAADLATFHLAIGATSVANASLLNNLAPLFAGAIAVVFGRPPSRRFWLGTALAIIGATVLFFPKFDRGSPELVGLGIGLTSALFFACYLLVVERLRDACSTITIVAWTGLAAAAVLLPTAWAAGEQLVPATLEGWIVLAALAIIAQGVGQALVVYALAGLSGPEAGAGILLQVVATAVLGVLLLGEAVGMALIVGGTTILLGVVMATSRGDGRGEGGPPIAKASISAS